MTPTDRDALARALDIAHKDRAEAKRIDNQLASGDDWFDVATSAAFHCQMTALNLLPWQSPPCVAHIIEPRRDEHAAELLHRLLAAGSSRYEPDPIAALAEAEAKAAP